MITWNKGQFKQLSKHFTSVEFSCRCTNSSCVEQQVDERLLTRLEVLRNSLGSPIAIHSGYRCHKRQQELTAKGLETAKGLSQHELGKAADIASSDMSHLENLVRPLFHSFGVARSFIHVDLREGNPDGSSRVWYYKGAKA